MTKREELAARAEQRRVEALVAEVNADFEARRRARKMLERGWELNMNFVSGNQFCDLTPEGELEEEQVLAAVNLGAEGAQLELPWPARDVLTGREFPAGSLELPGMAGYLLVKL